MWCEYKTHCLVTLIVIAGFIATGCATKTTSLMFTESEVKLIPIVAIQKVLSPRADETVRIYSSSVDGPAVVKGFEGKKRVIVMDKHGKEIELMTTEVMKIERIRRILRPDDSAKKGKSNTAGAVADTVFYAPMVPTAIVLWPFLRASGLDAGKNAEDKLKARLVYEGMSKSDLLKYIGEPMEKYLCIPKEQNRWSKEEEVWVYRKDQVLRGGRSLFINLDKGEVYYNSYDTSFFKKRNNCSLMK